MHKRVVDHIPCLYPLPYFGARSSEAPLHRLPGYWMERGGLCKYAHMCVTRAGGTDHLKCGLELPSSQGPSVFQGMQGEAESQSSKLGTFLCDCFLPFSPKARFSLMLCGTVSLRQKWRTCRGEMWSGKSLCTLQFSALWLINYCVFSVLWHAVQFVRGAVMIGCPELIIKTPLFGFLSLLGKS